MEQRTYKGFHIVPDPFLDPKTGTWTTHYLLFLADENNLNIQELSTNEAFDSEAAAKHRCFDHAKLVIDTNAPTTH
jgi:hypothetical protein